MNNQSAETQRELALIEVSYSLLASRRYMGHTVRSVSGKKVAYRILKGFKDNLIVPVKVSFDGLNYTYQMTGQPKLNNISAKAERFASA